MTRPWLSVVVPTHNGAAYLSAALDSIVAEADPDVEVIAIDDGSTDSTLDILTQYQPRLNLTINRRHAGNWAANSNEGLRLARGEYACFLHQDDFWMPGRLRKVNAQLQRTPANLLLHACEFVDRSGRKLGPWRCPYPAHRPLGPDRGMAPLLVQNFIGIPGAVFHRETALATGGLDESLWYTADWDLWLKLAAIGPTVYLPSILAAFRLHPQSQTARRSHTIDDFREQMREMMRRHFDAWPEADPARRDSVRRAARASVEVNVALAAAYHRQPVPITRPLSSLADLGVLHWRRFLNDSRLWERVFARCCAGFARRS